ncbi:hypothetical protein SCOR_32545 [Sulfidibacter corallicola]|uniref:Sulfite dehydrogenase (Cytochrome) subunit SorB n=1 Tax=Sulfidibacter corallicola TaxID=2818388 RepID=A0A8A4TI59_SULCO|nr:hypothetical protein [Sulfidibacter corallicola]QTD49729.1 hypothetical protein J3U87_29450 [Sulfidibacter corallicola]
MKPFPEHGAEPRLISMRHDALILFVLVGLIVLSSSVSLFAHQVKAKHEPEAAATPKVGPDGLIEAEGVVWVRANCTPCHSANLILQFRGDAHRWLHLIRWMQAKQGLWALAPDVEKAVVDYLATNYGDREGSLRRKPLKELPPPLPAKQ